jgi:tetratricopeptide (TPR) repeat protein
VQREIKVRVSFDSSRVLQPAPAQKAGKEKHPEKAGRPERAVARSDKPAGADASWLAWLTILSGQLPRGEVRRGPLTLVFFVVVIALIGSLYTIWQIASPLIRSDAKSAEERKLDEILERLKAVQASSGTSAAGASIDAQTREALERLLRSGDVDQQVAAELLRTGKIDEAINYLVATGRNKLGLSASARLGAVGNLYTAALLMSYRSLEAAKRLANRILAVEPLHVRTRVLLAQMHLNQGNPVAAREALQPVLSDPPLATAHSGLISNTSGLISLAFGDPKSAERFFRSALSWAKKAGNRHMQAAVLGNLGTVYDNLGDAERAKTYFNLSLALNEGKDPTLAGNAHCNLGMTLLSQNKLAGAEREFQQALDIFSYATDRTCLPNTLNGLGSVYTFREDFDKAVRYFQQGKLEADRLGATESRIQLRINLAQALYLGNAEYETDLLEALQIAALSPTRSKAFSYHEDARDRLLQYAANKGPGKLGSLQKAKVIVDSALAQIPAGDRQATHALTVDGVYLSCALGDQPSFKRFMRLSGKAAMDPPDPATGKIQLHVEFSEFVNVTEGIVLIQRDFGRNCLGGD